MSEGNGGGLRPVFVVDGSRTPFLKAKAKPGPHTAANLAVAAGLPLLLRLPFEPEEFDEVIVGCVIPGPREANIARVISLRLGCGKKTPAFTVNRNCASGMQAIESGALRIATGRAELVLVGGTEAMSHSHVLIDPGMRNWLADMSAKGDMAVKLKTLIKFRPSFLKPVIGLLLGLTDPVVGLSMGQTAEMVAHRFGIGRDEMDSFSMESHKRLADAIDNGWLSEIETIYDTKGGYYESDEGVRRDTTMEKLGRLKPVFDKVVGNVTAGNSAQVTDGAAMLVLASSDAVKKHKLPTLGRIVDSHSAGLDPSEMGLGPVHAMAPLMARRNLKAKDINYWEINEAFAAQVIGCLRAWNDKKYMEKELGIEKPLGEIKREKLNIDGGSISIGHPIGASGARIVLHLLKVLERKKAKRGLASLCIGGGQGQAMLVERD
ncbi:3-ketoacyl-CoA thiolase @ Acetyl-CoA acetyltransferase [hydrothermal vent metagenome]|uniref:3-ketoacyl-CoA thiolase @ Acetyl-CoA acetyltransferase n=1 Tax=hydrothermal vent metagenome TaxID=652676 RepID=A0A3B1CE93_9ZZZZ